MVVFLTIKRSLGDSMVSIEELKEKIKYWINVHEDIKKYLDDYFKKNGDIISITEINKAIKEIEYKNL